MRIDVVSIFPEYLAPLGLSLPGRAVESGLVDLRVHDLRAWTHDRHRTVDDTPYGGGAGMVMRPEPWGEALDELLADGGPLPRLLVMTPSGKPFSQADAVRLSREQRLVFACGRYEGIDARVAQWAATQMPVEEVSIGDYVLNGGEVAAMVCIEAIVRLVPGFMGNPASIVEESHSGEEPLLEYPAYTKPSTWRGFDVPQVLFSGDHARIARWRQQEAADRTRRRRPDLWTRRPVGPPLLDADPGSPPATDRFAFEALGPQHDGSGLAEVDLVRARVRHEAGVEYAWAVLDPATGDFLGGAQIAAGEAGPQLRSWVVPGRADLDRPLRRHLAAWLAGWPLAVRVPRR